MTRKLLVAFDPTRPELKSSDFLVPVVEDGRTTLLGLRSRKTQPMGLVVFTGKDLSPKDIFAKLVDTGRKIDSVDAILKDISDYLTALSNQQIGDVVAVDSQGESLALVKTGVRPAKKNTRLP